ncbi:hypothetical protein Pla175_49940 [Pirellulimonas nuda]|uniref:DUF1501 domain-containing protein n=1 Tax=Pirellulimonas nuda TaxID=2528009 RepID=A0A518DJB4_9BACT|nr:DUF1501 domain-containing protein [Pirellulimonas nuda]QDU91565.1 hypothetical protein Pla175_49940 [Pirellulimonas nuda]
MLQHHIRVATDARRVTSRRDFLRTIGAGAAAGGTLSLTDRLCLAAPELRRRGKACILLWMAGGPSQFETFSPKPGHSNGGETKAISTKVPGIQVSANLPELAGVMDELAIIRSMTSKEGSHPRASFYMHHGYLPMGGVKFPTLGSNVAHQIGDAANELPSYVRIGDRSQNAGNGGFLGVDYDPLVLSNPTKPPENAKPYSSKDRYQRRLALLSGFERDFGAVQGADVVADHKKLVAAASEMILSPKMEAFDIEREPQSVRDAYGEGQFAAGCLLARRLIEAGVTFIEVGLGGWDTHQDNFAKVAENCGKIDRPAAALIRDLKSRGMLDDTLVIWTGEFGRTPKINPRGGRDHYPRAFNSMLAGGGVRGGQVIGQTDAAGADVTERPVGVKDLFQTVYTSLGIDPSIENQSLIGRPIKLVDEGSPVTELL